jgi:hypothetical protein
MTNESLEKQFYSQLQVSLVFWLRVKATLYYSMNSEMCIAKEKTCFGLAWSGTGSGSSLASTS